MFDDHEWNLTSCTTHLFSIIIINKNNKGKSLGTQISVHTLFFPHFSSPGKYLNQMPYFSKEPRQS